jgi:drug/metabolite transporter (DMT)-like permease
MKPLLVWLLLCCIWGSTWLFIKLGLEDLPPFTFAGIRFVIAVAILSTIVALRRLSLPRTSRDWLLLFVSGLLAFCVNYGLLFWGEQYISSGLAAVLQSTIPAFGLVIAHFYLPDEQMTPAKIIGIVLGVIGVAVIFSNQLDVAGSMAVAGCAALTVSSMGAAYSNVLVKAYGKHLDPAILAGGQMFFGLIPLLLIGIPWEGNPINFNWTPMAVVSLIYLAVVGSVVAFLLYYWLVQNMDVTKTMLIALVTPVVAVTLGMLVLDEELHGRTLLGGLMIISGIGIIVTRQADKKGQSPKSKIQSPLA